MTTLQEAIDKCESVAIESGAHESYKACRDAFADLRAALAQQELPQPLTDKRISWLWSESHNDTTDRMAFQVFARAIEAAHGIREVNER